MDDAYGSAAVWLLCAYFPLLTFGFGYIIGRLKRIERALGINRDNELR